MSKLKTLKDLEATEWNSTHTQRFEKWVNVSELKQEAIKWVKSYEKSFENPACNEEQENKYLGAISFLKHFFNLTEEDLK
ncbi:MAG: hypothetical protein J7J96_04020 [Sulfurimonas sp.]|nr:hypothetical protein [Sulfurimonas sp.]